MIDRYTIKFGPFVSQKESEKELHESGNTPDTIPDLRKMKVRIEIVAEFEDVKKIDQYVKSLKR